MGLQKVLFKTFAGMDNRWQSQNVQQEIASVAVVVRQ